LANTADLRELQLRLTIVTFEAALHVVERLQLRSTSHRRFVAAAYRGAHQHFALPRVNLILIVEKLHGLFGALIRVHLHSLLTAHPIDDTWGALAAPIDFAELSRRQLAIAVRVLRLVLVEQPLLCRILHHVHGLLFAAGLAMLLGKHGHLVGVRTHILPLVIDDRLHRLLIVLATVVAIQVVTLNVDHGGALTQLAPYFIYFVFVQAGSAIAGLHFWETAALGPRLRDRALSVLVLELDARLLHLLLGVGSDFGDFVD